jgi:amino-acid N-acetyltransferase
MRVDRAMPADEPAIEALLAQAGLPLDGAAAAFEHGVVARDANRIVGAAAVELYDGSGLLRSVVVAADRRGTGVGREVVRAAEDLARAEGIHELYLLTETAEQWFPRLGYERVDRHVAAAAVGASIEFTTVCRDTGVALRRGLG